MKENCQYGMWKILFHFISYHALVSKAFVRFQKKSKEFLASELTNLRVELMYLHIVKDL